MAKPFSTHGLFNDNYSEKATLFSHAHGQEEAAGYHRDCDSKKKKKLHAIT